MAEKPDFGRMPGNRNLEWKTQARRNYKRI